MDIEIHVKNSKESLKFRGDRIDILDFEREGIKYKQIRCFKKGFSKSTYIQLDLIKRIVEKKN